MSNNPFGATTSFSNNPFVEDPATRFPAITDAGHTSGGVSSPFASLQSPGAGVFSGPGFPPQQQPQQYPQYQSQPQAGYQPPALFSPGPYSPVAAPQSFSYTGTSHQSALPQLQQFDPLLQGPSATAWSSASQLSQPQAAASWSSGGGGFGVPRPMRRPEDHPRLWIQSHKAELEIWDPVSWKQALAAFDELAREWERHKAEVDLRVQAAARGYLNQQEGAMWQNMAREAIANIDSITASKLQMSEAYAGYRQSSDLGSMRRVKECLNASLRGLPDWPPQ